MRRVSQFKPLALLTVVISLLTILYSWTQADLNLTVSRITLTKIIIEAFQWIGYYNRSVSTLLFIVLLGTQLLLYIVIIRRAYQSIVTPPMIILLSILLSGMLLLSYPAFSYDIFNYTFTAKTVVLYQKNPYVVIPREFWSIDPWVNSMRWIHLPSAYTPLWIIFTLPTYYLGFGKLLPTMFFVKCMTAGFYLITIIMTGKIMKVFKPKYESVAMALIAFNPLIIIESLVSSHNDIVMMGVVMTGLYLFFRRHYWFSLFIISISVAIKLMTIFIYPVLIYTWITSAYSSWLNRKTSLYMAYIISLKQKMFGKNFINKVEQKFDQNIDVRIILICFMVFGLFLVMTKREILPWYFVWIVPFTALTPEHKWIQTLVIGISMGLLLRYAPFLYFGHWNPPVTWIKDVLTLSMICISLFSIFRFNKKKY